MTKSGLLLLPVSLCDIGSFSCPLAAPRKKICAQKFPHKDPFLTTIFLDRDIRHIMCVDVKSGYWSVSDDVSEAFRLDLLTDDFLVALNRHCRRLQHLQLENIPPSFTGLSPSLPPSVSLSLLLF